jgi:hypothetical protein
MVGSDPAIRPDRVVAATRAHENPDSRVTAPRLAGPNAATRAHKNRDSRVSTARLARLDGPTRGEGGA